MCFHSSPAIPSSSPPPSRDMALEEDFSRSSFRNKTANVKAIPANAVLIDLDDDDDDDAFIDDAPGRSQPELRSFDVEWENGNSSCEGVINIKDNDTDDDKVRRVEPATRPVGDEKLFSDVSSRKRNFQEYQSTWTSANLGEEKFEVREKTSGFQFSKCKKTYITTTPGGNRRGMVESDSVDSDFSDCEIIEDPFGKLHEQWERAANRRKQALQNRLDLEEQGSAFESYNEAQISTAANRRKPALRNRLDLEEQGSAFESYNEAKTSIREEHGDDQRSRGSGGGHTKNLFKPRSESTFVDADWKAEHENPTSVPFEWNTYFQQTNSSVSSNPFERNTDFQHKKSSVPSNPHCRYVPQTSEGTYAGIPCYKSKEPSRQGSFHPGGFPSTEYRFCCNECKSYQEFYNVIPYFFCVKDFLLPGFTFTSIEQDVREKQFMHWGWSSKEEEKFDHGQPSASIVRENLKDTDEYKRAAEEEWAARQQELEIQAKEAQRLRKKRKAENDIERRQKQRVEEVRQAQKKDAEDTNLKEYFREEIMRDVKLLEISCMDMASLLRGLGVQVACGFSPEPHHINAAYKKAILKFHPDRFAKCGIRQQVEAEEKFKLIYRMKEKFVLKTSIQLVDLLTTHFSTDFLVKTCLFALVHVLPNSNIE